MNSSQQIEEVISTSNKTRAIVTLLSLTDIEGLDSESLGWICTIMRDLLEKIETNLHHILNHGN